MGVARGAALVALAVFAPAVFATEAHAEVDWAKGLVTASGLGVADRHAPSPAAAREPARRAAEDQARKTLAAQLPALPLAAGGTLKTKLGDQALEARLARAVAAAITIEATPHTDGSWNVTLAVPIEAIRQAIAGPRESTKADADLPVVVIEGVTAKPAVGYTIDGVAAATLWVPHGDLPAWAKDAPRVKATGSTTGSIALAKPAGASTLFVIVIRR